MTSSHDLDWLNRISTLLANDFNCFPYYDSEKKAWMVGRDSNRHGKTVIHPIMFVPTRIWGADDSDDLSGHWKSTIEEAYVDAAERLLAHVERNQVEATHKATDAMRRAADLRRVLG